jgi:hypothetical protein
MNTNTNDLRRATERAQANANWSGRPRWLQLWNGTLWISKTEPADPVRRVDPRPESKTT